MDSCISDLTTQRVLAYIDAHFHRPITPRNIAAALHYSLGHLTHLTRKTMGCSVGELLLRRRIDSARRMLEETFLPIAAIAARAGFTDIAYFSRRFSQHMGISPSHWRKQHSSRQRSHGVCHVCGQLLPLISPTQDSTAEMPEAAS